MRARSLAVGILMLLVSAPSIPASAAEASGRVLEFHVGADFVLPRVARMQPGDTIRAVFAERLWISCYGGGQQCFSGIKNPGEAFEFLATSPAFSFGVILESTFHGEYDCSGACATLFNLDYETPVPVEPQPGGVYTTAQAGELPETARVTFVFEAPKQWQNISFRDIYRNAPRFMMDPVYRASDNTYSVTLSLINGFHRWRIWFSRGYHPGGESVGYPIDLEFIVDGPDLTPPKILLSPPTRIAGQSGEVASTLSVGSAPINVSGAVQDDGTVVSIEASLRPVGGASEPIVLRCSVQETNEIVPCAQTPEAPHGPARRRVIVSGKAVFTGASVLTVTATDLAGRVSRYQRTIVSA